MRILLLPGSQTPEEQQPIGLQNGQSLFVAVQKHVGSN